MSRCCGSHSCERKNAGARLACRNFRSLPGNKFTIAGIGVTVRGDGKSGGIVRSAGLSRPASPARCRSAWSIRPAQGARERGSAACTGDSGAPVFEDQQGGPVIVGVVQLVDRAERQRGLRRPDRRHAADALPRLDFADRAAMGFRLVKYQKREISNAV